MPRIPIIEGLAKDRIHVQEFEYCQFDQTKNELNVMADGGSGFFNNCNITLRALCQIYPSQSYVRVNWSQQNLWRDKSQIGINLFEAYFRPNDQLDPHGLVRIPLPFLPHDYKIYEDLRFDLLAPYVGNYFQRSAIVQRKQEEFQRQYGIEYENTIGLAYRATDKWIEVAQIQPAFYIREAKRLLAKDPSLRVLVQTDQKQVRDLCIKELGEQAFYLNEMPVTTSTIGMHILSESERGVPNFEFGVRLLAAVSILANCKYVITSSSSVGLWIYLLRGTARNACQLRPAPPDIFSRFDGEVGIKRATMKLLRRLIIND